MIDIYNLFEKTLNFGPIGSILAFLATIVGLPALIIILIIGATKR